MISTIISLLGENKGVSTVIAALTVVALLGGTGAVTLPADAKVAELQADYRLHLAQASQHDTAAELRQIRWEIEGLRRDLQYMERAGDFPQSEIDNIRETIRWLKDRESQILDALGQVG